MGGKQGKGHQDTCIKDTWTKTKRVGSRVRGKDAQGGEGVGGINGDNYTKTTIKKRTVQKKNKKLNKYPSRCKKV